MAKYIDFIDIYSALDDNEMREYVERYPQESKTMATLSERLRAEGQANGLQQGLEQGLEQGMQQGLQQGQRGVLARLLNRRFGPLNPETQQRLEAASQADLERWTDRILEARVLEEVFQDH